jgi:5-methyltetrahydrofolate--homocysteine methyltransferase
MDWRDVLKERGFLVSDGAWGTELAKLGLPAGEATELWNVDNPSAVEKVALSYVKAGSDIILTNTFGGNRMKLAKRGLGDRVVELNRRGVELSLQGAAGRAFVFASIGPTGEMIEPLGSKTEAEMIECFAEQIVACARGGVDGLCIETMSDLGEALAAYQAARKACKLPVVVSMTYEKGARDYATMMGVRPAVAAKTLDQAGVDMVGANCGNGIANMIEVARLMRSATRKPLWLKANAGMPELIDGKTVFSETPAAMAAQVPALLKAGAGIIGGCCGTTPAHIKKMVAAARQAKGAS